MSEDTGSGGHPRDPREHTAAGGHELRVISERVPPPSAANDLLVIGGALLAAAGGATFGIGLTVGAPVLLYGTALGVALLAMGFAVRRYFTARYPDIEAIEPRTSPGGEEVERVADVEPIGRRPLMTRVLLGAGAVLGLGLVAPVASLGPAPQGRLRRTAWSAGTRVVDDDGRPVRADDVAAGGFVNVWPQGAIGAERSAALLLRLSTEPTTPTNLDWVVDGTLVGYSKICTHAGCPVGLYRERDNALFCPCHQSTFDVVRGAAPTFGPTARALPQLPLGVDDDGYLVAVSDFTEQVGPAFG